MRYASILSEAIETEKSNGDSREPKSARSYLRLCGALRLCAKRQLRKGVKPQRNGRARLGPVPGEPFTLSLVHTSEACVNPSLKLGFVERLQFAIEEHTTGDDRKHNVATHRTEYDRRDRVVHRCVVSA